MRGAARKIVQGIVIALISVVLLEVALRILGLFPADSEHHVNDARLEFRLRPHIEFGSYTTNARGFNDREREAEKSRGMRVAIVGDSFVWGAGVERADNVTSVLQQMADSLGLDVEFINMGIPAAGPRTYLGLLETDAALLNVDHAIVVLYSGNDILSAHPDFERKVWLGRPREVLRQPFLVGPSVEYFYTFRQGRAISRLLREHLRAAFGTTEGLLAQRNVASVYYWSARTYQAPPSSFVEKAYQGLDVLLVQMKGVAHRGAFGLYVVLAPSEFEVNTALRHDVIKAYDMRTSALDIDQPRKRIAEIAEREGILFLDLTLRFKALDQEHVLYLDGDTHWNRLGHRMAAAELFQNLIVPIVEGNERD